ncbi:hypothetical protein [uncultured Cocleimonas sp.]|uniref:hypothetical protein n=1 Tax=uncultured Cocleimonas sp. TaxID=1051587 RepID=UPI00261E7D1A|nr:hypothetical protein [uncultured Cocleimonas sp.]
MYIKQIILTTIASVLIAFLVAYTFNFILFADIFEAMGTNTRKEPIVALAIVAKIIYGIVLAYLYPYFYKKGDHPVVQGIKFSLIIEAVAYAFNGFVIAAKYNVDPILTYLVLIFILHVILAVFTGIPMGLIFGEIEKKDSYSE